MLLVGIAALPGAGGGGQDVAEGGTRVQQVVLLLVVQQALHGAAADGAQRVEAWHLPGAGHLRGRRFLR